MKSNEQNQPKAKEKAPAEQLCWRVFWAFGEALRGSWNWSHIADKLPIVRANLPALTALLSEDLAVASAKAGGPPRGGRLPTIVSEIAPVLALGLPAPLPRIAQAVAQDLCAMTLDSKPWRGTPVLQAAERLGDALAALSWAERFTVLSALLFGRDMAEIGRALHTRMSDPADCAVLHLEAALERMNRFYEIGRAEEARWYVVEVRGGSERVAKFHLERQRFEVYMPLRFSLDAARAKFLPFFPRYVFVRMDAEDRQWGAINNTMGVVGMIARADGRPAPIATAMIERIRSWERGEAIPLVPRPIEQVKDGDAVRVTAGPMAGLDAIIHTGNDAKRSRMMLEFAEYPESSFKIVAQGSADKVAVLR